MLHRNVLFQPSPADLDPHLLTVSFPQPVAMKGVVLMPRQNDRNHQGGIRAYRLETSDDGQQWHEVRSGTLASTFHPLTVDFGRIVTTSHLRLTSLSGFGEDPATALAELTVIPTEPRFGGKGTEPVEYRRVRSTSTEVEENN